MIFFVFLLSCSGNRAETSVQEEQDKGSNLVSLTREQAETAGIALGNIEFKQISNTIRVNGHLDVPPQELISVSVPFGGFIKNTEVLQGSRVRKGEVIAVIENPEYITLQQDYLEAKSQLEFTQADYDRQQELARENVNAVKTLQQSRNAYQMWLAKAKGLEAKLKMLHVDPPSLDHAKISGTINLYAPIDGYVTQVNVNIGKYVSPTDVIIEIVDTRHLHAELIVFEKDIPRIRIGQKVRFTFSNEEIERMATVYLIGREISPDRTVRIHCHLDKEDIHLLPGMYLSGVVEAGGAEVSAVPDNAIVHFQGKQYIFIPDASGSLKNSDTTRDFEMVEVTTGASELGYTEIKLTAIVTKETRLVVNGSYSLLGIMKNTGEE